MTQLMLSFQFTRQYFVVVVLYTGSKDVYWMRDYAPWCCGEET